MKDESNTTRLEIEEIAGQLRDGRLSRSALFGRLKGLGIGFGAAFLLGVSGAQAANAPEATVAVKSTNAAINSIIQKPPQAPVAGVSTPLQQVAYYHRYYHRYYMRHYNRYYSRY
jgi:hypothetical protein